MDDDTKNRVTAVRMNAALIAEELVRASMKHHDGSVPEALADALISAVLAVVMITKASGKATVEVPVKLLTMSYPTVLDLISELELIDAACEKAVDKPKLLLSSGGDA